MERKRGREKERKRELPSRIRDVQRIKASHFANDPPRDFAARF